MTTSQKPFYITTPIYYVNSTPHLGHAYTSILCDAVNRYSMLQDKNCFFLTGTDEHGDKIAKSAAEQNLTPQALTDKNSAAFKELLPQLEVKNTDFIRTTDPEHIALVQRLLQKVHDKGDIYFAEYEGKYCVGCERFLGDDELVDGLCSDHQKAPEKIKEKNYFFKMGAYWEKLKNHIDANPDFIAPEQYRKEVLGLLNSGPQDLCISRPKTRLTWGVELPFDENFVTYVWFDALINYLSGPEKTNKRDLFWPAAHHVIAKDILKPHCLYWPCMLMSMEIPLPQQVAVHGYWLMDENKMSKSLGNRVEPLAYIEKYGTAAFRYFLLRNMRFGRDANFSHKEFVQLNNAELANNLGNLYSRVAGMLRKACPEGIPAPQKGEEAENAIEQGFYELKEKTNSAMAKWSTHHYGEALIQYADTVNKYIDETKPWSLGKEIKENPDSSSETRKKLERILRTSLEAVRGIFTYLWPWMPSHSEAVLGELGLGHSLEDLKKGLNNWELLPTGHPMPKKVTGLQRIDHDEKA